MTAVFQERSSEFSQPRRSQSRAVRQVGGGPVVCEACGCRLESRETDLGSAWQHFSSSRLGRDARGCSVACVTDVHELFIAYS
jgi:transcription initiation factor TFIIIB Brf1 subunit/transcription initiation factor TFIIB